MDDPDPANVFLKLLLLLALILVNAFFAMSEIAIISLNDNKIKKMAEDGDKKAIKVLRLIENPSSFLSTIQLGVTLAGFLTSASAAGNFSEPLAKAISSAAGISPLLFHIFRWFWANLLRNALQCKKVKAFRLR